MSCVELDGWFKRKSPALFPELYRLCGTVTDDEQDVHLVFVLFLARGPPPLGVSPVMRAVKVSFVMVMSGILGCL